MVIADAEYLDLPEAAARLGHSVDAIKRMLKRRVDLERRIARRWGRRLLTKQNVEELRRAFAEREKAAAK